MYLHKYVSDGDTFYRVTAKADKPGGTTNIQMQDWKGKATGSNVNTALSAISKAFREDEVKEPEDKKAPESEPKKATVADAVRIVAMRMNKEQ